MEKIVKARVISLHCKQRILESQMCMDCTISEIASSKEISCMDIYTWFSMYICPLEETQTS